MTLDLTTGESILVGAALLDKIDNCIPAKVKDFEDLLLKIKLQITEQIEDDELEQEQLLLNVEKIIFSKH